MTGKRSLPCLLAGTLFALAAISAPWARGESQTPPPPQRPGAESGPTKVGYAVWFGDVTGIDSVAQTFTANIYILLHWNDPRLRHAGPGTKMYALKDIWHPPAVIANESKLTSHTWSEIAEVTPDGNVMSRQWLVGSFTQWLDLRSFPFDREDFEVHLVFPGYTPQDLQFQPEAAAVAMGFNEGVGRAAEFTLQDWAVISTSASSRPKNISPNLELAGLKFGFTATRKVQYYLIKVGLPLLLIVMMSWSVFWIEPSEGGPQFSIAVTSMLTLIAYRFAIESNVPKLPYLTRLDAFILMGTLLVFLSLIEVIVVTKLVKRDRLPTARAIDRTCRWAIPLVFTISTAAILLH